MFQFILQNNKCKMISIPIFMYTCEKILYRQQFRLQERRWTVELLNEGGQVINLCFGIAISAIDAVVGGSMQQQICEMFRSVNKIVGLSVQEKTVQIYDTFLFFHKTFPYFLRAVKTTPR